MDSQELHVVTGAFGYTGRYIARLLLARGKVVRTLTRRVVNDSPFADQIDIWPLDFGDTGALTESLRGATTLYNTYWVRLPDRGTGYEQAVRNSQVLIKAAADAGVRRLVHIGVTNNSEASSLPYFHGKWQVENAVRSSGLSHAIIRPTLVFGDGDILINNIAWFLRKFPIFLIAGSGNYPVQPVYAGDVAEMAVSAADGNANLEIDAVGPESFTYREMVRLIASSVGGRAKIVGVPPRAALLASKMVGLLLRDVVLTREEVDGLMAGLLVSPDATPSPTSFSSWLEEKGSSLGRRYVSELDRHYR